jgi:RNA polymerase primary sigma factor
MAARGACTYRATERRPVAPDRSARRETANDARERRLVLYCRCGDRDAQARLVDAYLPAVRQIAAQYRGLGLAHDDLVQEGALGLLDAVGRYDPGRGRPFEPYARFRIRRAIKRALTEQSRLIRLPKHILERRRTIARAEARLLAKGTAATPETVAGETGLSVSAVLAARGAPRSALSLDEHLDDGTPLAHLVADPAAGDPADAVLTGERVAQLERSVALLPRQQRHVVARRFGLDSRPPVSARALAADLDLSPRRTQAIAHEALTALRRGLDA